MGPIIAVRREDEPLTRPRQAPRRRASWPMGKACARAGVPIILSPSVSYFTHGPILALYGLTGTKGCFGESIAMTLGRISTGLAAAALLALPMQSGARADTGAKVIEEVDFT